MTRLFIDADACPVTREALSIARAHKVPATMIANSAQNLTRYAQRDGVECIEVSGGRDAADFAIVERLHPGDVVVTQDLGLAAMALGRGATSLSPRGRIHSAATIDAELALRHAEQKYRRAGGRTQGPSAMDEEDRERFSSALQRLLSEARK